MKRCELCKKKARLQCGADQASLCWECDSKVHSANFLVARHSRSLLCHVCGSRSMWSAAGARVVPIVSVCEQCADGVGEPKVDPVLEENQVVPLSPPVAAESCSSSEGVGWRTGGFPEAMQYGERRTQFQRFTTRRPTPYAASHAEGGISVVSVGFPKEKRRHLQEDDSADSCTFCGPSI